MSIGTGNNQSDKFLISFSPRLYITIRQQGTSISCSLHIEQCLVSHIVHSCIHCIANWTKTPRWSLIALHSHESWHSSSVFSISEVGDDEWTKKLWFSCQVHYGHKGAKNRANLWHVNAIRFDMSTLLSKMSYIKCITHQRYMHNMLDILCANPYDI